MCRRGGRAEMRPASALVLPDPLAPLTPTPCAPAMADAAQVLRPLSVQTPCPLSSLHARQRPLGSRGFVITLTPTHTTSVVLLLVFLIAPLFTTATPQRATPIPPQFSLAVILTSQSQAHTHTHRRAHTSSHLTHSNPPPPSLSILTNLLSSPVTLVRYLVGEKEGKAAGLGVGATRTNGRWGRQVCLGGHAWRKEPPGRSTRNTSLVMQYQSSFPLRKSASIVPWNHPASLSSHECGRTRRGR